MAVEAPPPPEPEDSAGVKEWTAAALAAFEARVRKEKAEPLPSLPLPETPQPPAASAPMEEEEEEEQEQGGGSRRRGQRASRKRKRAKSQPEPEPEPEPTSAVVVAVEDEGLVRLKGLVAEARSLARRLGALFEWADGPLVEAMRDGHLLLLDEVGGCEGWLLCFSFVFYFIYIKQSKHNSFFKLTNQPTHHNKYQSSDHTHIS
jgi:hypothetical protein